MSNGDFEVMPIGTMEELRTLREFVQLLERVDNMDDFNEMYSKLKLWYASQIERYPLA